MENVSMHAIVRGMLVRFSAALLVAIILLLLMPFVLPQEARAQVPNVGGQATTSSSCPTITVSLQRGSRGSHVTSLQQFLAARYGVPLSDIATGYFGPLTESYVKKFQTEQSVSSIGIVGPQTRAAIARVCGGGGSSSLPAGVSMSTSPLNGPGPLTVAFVVIAQATPCGSYILDFGDGQSQSLPSFCGTRTIPHVYQSLATFNAHLDELVNTGGQISRLQRAQSAITAHIATAATSTAPTPTCVIGATKTSIYTNESATLTWSSTNATGAKWQDGSSTGTSGSALFSNLAATTVKSITFTGTGGTKSCSITITVNPPPIGTIVASGNAIANGAVAELPADGQSAFKLADFTLTAGSVEDVRLTSFSFTLRNQTAAAAPGAATVSNYRVAIGTGSYSVSVSHSGLYDTGTVSLGSGVTVSAKQSLGVGIFADVVPNSGGHLDLWVYPDDMRFTGVKTGTAIKPTSTVTNRVDTNLVYWSGWIAVQAAKAAAKDEEPVGDCFLDGKGYTIDTGDASCSKFFDPSDPAGNYPTDQCKKYLDGSLICTASGWAGNAVNPPNSPGMGGTKVACMSSNGLFIPANGVHSGNTCIPEYNTAGCDGAFICRKDGWWTSDTTGYPIQKWNGRAPWIAPEDFYYQFPNNY